MAEQEDEILPAKQIRLAAGLLAMAIFITGFVVEMRLWNNGPINTFALFSFIGVPILAVVAILLGAYSRHFVGIIAASLAGMALSVSLLFLMMALIMRPLKG